MMNNQTNFLSEDMARNATRAWSLAKSIKVAMVSLRDAPVPGPSTTEPLSATFEKPDAHVPQPMRARFRDDSNAIFFIIPAQSVFAGKSRILGVQSLLVTFSNGEDGDHISFEGSASLSEDRGIMESLWDSHADIHFPEGPTDSTAMLMEFHPRTAHFWTGGQDIVSFAVHYVTAKLTGEPQAVGKQGVVKAM